MPELVPVLQTAIGPVILISGVGLLLLSMTNRLGHVIDRVRMLAAERDQAGGEAAARIGSQLEILWGRARLLRAAIILASTSALCAAVLVILLFAAALERLESTVAITILFVLCMGALIGSLVAFIRDINRSLTALRLELQGRSPGRS